MTRRLAGFALLMFAVLTPPARANWPDWVKPGARLTYRTMSATVAGSADGFQIDGSGTWVDARTGQSTRGNASAEGFEQYTLFGVSPQRIIVDHKVYNTDPGGQGLSPIPTSPIRVTRQLPCDGFRHPEDLAKYPDGQTGSTRVLRYDMVVNEQTSRAIRITETAKGMRTSKVYDRDTGVLLESSLVGDVQTKEDEGAKVMIIYNQFAGYRNVDLPWIGMSMTPEAQQIKFITANYTTEMSLVGSNVAAPAQQFELQLTIQQHDGEMLIVKTDKQQAILTLVITYWIDPRILARLQPNQQLDVDPHLGMTTRTSTIQDGQATIIIDGLADRFVSRYDLQTGFITDHEISKTTDIAETTNRAKYTMSKP